MEKLDVVDALFAAIENNADYAWKRLEIGPFAGHRIEIHANRFKPGVYNFLQFNEKGIQVLGRSNISTEEISSLAISYGQTGWEPGTPSNC